MTKQKMNLSETYEGDMTTIKIERHEEDQLKESFTYSFTDKKFLIVEQIRNAITNVLKQK